MGKREREVSTTRLVGRLALAACVLLGVTVRAHAQAAPAADAKPSMEIYGFAML